MARLLHPAGLLSLLLCAHRASALRVPAEGEPPDVARFAPKTVIGGIGDSGTTAITRALHHLGLPHCHDRDQWLEPPWSFLTPEGALRDAVIANLIETARGHITRAAYQLRKDLWQDAVDWVSVVAWKDSQCIRRESGVPAHKQNWGFKEPHFAWLLPVMDSAFHNLTSYLIISRDPRDICTNILRDQFQEYGEKALHMLDCYAWWALFWGEILDNYEHTGRMKILRVEDLVVPDPSQTNSSAETLQCVLGYMGLNASRHAVERELRGFHEHVGTYMGHHHNMTEKDRRELEQQLAEKTEPPRIHSVMKRLGYSHERFELLAPASASVCSR